MKKLVIPAALIIASALLVAVSAQEPAKDPPGMQPEGTPPVNTRPGNTLTGDGQPESAGPQEPAPGYVGARKCKVCHLEIHKSWETTKHAWALAALNDEQLESPGCLACHTTGLGNGGYGAGSGAANLGGVQCEACHGPGSLYARSSVMRDPELRIEMGLVKPDSLTCVTCHNSESPTFKGFAYQAGLSTGTHSR
ncbi:MAG: multiheme c-type cytochrome [bacterium]|jgi:hypothetical protein